MKIKIREMIESDICEFPIEFKAKKYSSIIYLGVGLHKGYGKAQRLYIKRGYIPDGSGLWYKNKQLEQNEACINNDELIIYLSKKIK